MISVAKLAISLFLIIHKFSLFSLESRSHPLRKARATPLNGFFKWFSGRHGKEAINSQIFARLYTNTQKYDWKFQFLVKFLGFPIQSQN